ncbi:MAG: TRAP transporter fused permease subunit [Planctomycetaceae bacterium]|nr:TRAP transporter fused permease subunit [Planctomycetaceae bacterium]
MGSAPSEKVAAGVASLDHPDALSNAKSERPRIEDFLRSWGSLLLVAALTVFVLVEVNFSQLSPLKQIALFVTAGLLLCFLQVPIHPALRHSAWFRGLDYVFMALALFCCAYMLFEGNDLGQRAALYTTTDQAVGTIGLLLILEAARRTVGWSLPILAVLFIVYAHQSVAQQLPDWMFPHRGQDWESIIGQTYLRTQGVFGTAASVMFRYVFLYVVFGALLQLSGATEYIIGIAVRIFGKRSGGPAKIAVIASGVMGSLSGSAVANAATTGAFTIPLMKNVGFKPHDAAGVEAAASSGGALMPPVMGAGAYMMMEIINRPEPVRYIEIMQAALIPAILYYLSIFLLVHFSSKRIDAEKAAEEAASSAKNSVSALIEERGKHAPLFSFAGLSFFSSLTSLLVFLTIGLSPYRAVAYSAAIVVAILMIDPNTKVPLRSRFFSLGLWGSSTAAAFYLAPAGFVGSWGDALILGLALIAVVGIFSPAWAPFLHKMFRVTAEGSIPLIVAAASVGVIVGLVSRTGIGTAVPQAIIPLAADNLFLGLVAIMTCSLVLGMGLPSAVSYMLLATIIGPVFAEPQLGVPILAAHLFIFYFGMMAMVTPPVALAAYATASIAQASVFWSSMSAFRYSLVGFTLPFMFVYRPALLLMNETGGPPVWSEVVVAIVAAVLGIVALSSAMSGFLLYRLTIPMRVLLFLAASSALFPDQFNLLGKHLQLFDLIGGVLLATAVVWNWRSGQANLP